MKQADRGSASLARRDGLSRSDFDKSLLERAERENWARFSSWRPAAQGAYRSDDADAGRPVDMAVTAANVNDITAARAMPIEAGAKAMRSISKRLRLRLGGRSSMGGRRIRDRFQSTRCAGSRTAVAKDGVRIRSRRILPARQAKNRKPFATVRQVRVRIETGKILRILQPTSTRAPKSRCSNAVGKSNFFSWTSSQ